MTRAPLRYALLGDPVEHSRSPALHNAAFHALGIAATYELRRVAAADAPRVLRELALAGGGGNVTIPHKQLVVAALDRQAPAVRRTGACNTFWGLAGEVHGDNTDVAGFLGAIAHHGVALRGARVLLLGAGGAAAAVVAGLLDAGAPAITLVNRDPARATALAERFAGQAVLRTCGAPPPERFDVVINATSLGLRPEDPLPLAVDRLPPGCVVLDLVYSRGLTPWVRAARAAGHTAFDGEEMLLRQAAAAFERWTQREAPLPVMRAALSSRPGG